MNDFEELAHRSSDALRSAVDTDPIPDFRGPANRTPVVIAALVLIAALVGGGVWLNNRDGDDVRTDRAGTEDESGTGEDTDADGADEGDADGGASDPADYRLIWLDPAYELESALEIPPQTDAPPAHTTLYGRGTASEPFRDGDLLISSFIDDDGRQADFSGPEIEVRGGLGYRDRTLGELGFGDAVAFYDGDLAVVVASRSMSFDVLVQVADGLVIDGVRALSPLSSLSPVVEIDALPFARLGVRDGAWQVSYASDEGQRGVGLLGFPTDDPDVVLHRYMIDGEEAVSVRGVDGWLVTDSVGVGDTATMVFWEEEGVFLSLTAFGIDAVEAANELTQISLSEWESIVGAQEADSPAATFTGGEPSQVASGRDVVGSEQIEWSVLVAEGEMFCLQIDSAQADIGGRQCGSLGPSVAVIDHALVTAQRDVVAVAGTVSEAVSQLVLEDATGPIEEIAIAGTFVDGRRVFAAAFRWVDPLHLVALDAEGNELFRKSYDLGDAGPDSGDVGSVGSDLAPDE